MKSNFLIKVTDKADDSEHWFTNKLKASNFVGCSPSYFKSVENATARKFDRYKIEYADASRIMWADIDNVD